MAETISIDRKALICMFLECPILFMVPYMADVDSHHSLYLNGKRLHPNLSMHSGSKVPNQRRSLYRNLTNILYFENPSLIVKSIYSFSCITIVRPQPPLRLFRSEAKNVDQPLDLIGCGAHG